MRSHPVRSALFGVVLLGVGCQRASPEAQVERGEVVYQEHCAWCHDVEGGIGVKISASVLQSYGTARTLFNYTRLAMPYAAPSTLSEDDYWAVVAYMLDAQGLGAGATLTAATADSVRLGP